MIKIENFCEISQFWKRSRIEAEGAFRWNPLVRYGFAIAKEAAELGKPRPNSPQELAEAIRRLSDATRWRPWDWSRRRLQVRLQGLARRVDWQKVDFGQLFPGSFQTGSHLWATAVLKPYLGPRERGVVFCSMVSESVRLLALPDVEDFARRYDLIAGVATHPPFDLSNYLLGYGYPNAVYRTLSNPRDPAYLAAISDRFHVVPLYASSWVNPDLFDALPPERRDIDIIVVSSWIKLKRHYLLFRALRKLPHDLRVMLVGQDQEDRTVDAIREEARAFGVEDRLEIRRNVPYHEVVKLYGRARISLILSRLEGSCVAVTEAMAANTPVGVLEDSVVGSRVFINPQTGRLLRRRGLHRELLRLLEDAPSFQPRAWMIEHIACRKSSEVLNEYLKRQAVAEGREWTQDIAPICRTPHVRLLHQADADRTAPDVSFIKDRFGVEILNRVVESS